MHLSFDIGSGKFQGREASQWRPIGHEWSTCCRPVTVPCLFITHRTPLMPWSKIYFLASHPFRFPSLNRASSSLSIWACTFLTSARRRYAELREI